MGRPYSLDLRERVVEAGATTSRRQAAARFGVGVATSIRWMAALTTTRTVAPRPQGRARRSKLDPHGAFLRGLIDEKADITLEELRAPLWDEHALAVGLGTLWSFLDARDLTCKKNSSRRRAGAAGREGSPRSLIRGSDRPRSGPPRVPRRDMDLD